LLNHERTAFLKFFTAYFASVAPLILLAGYFYFTQMKNHLLKAEEFSIIEYARHIKMHEDLTEYSHDFHHQFIHKENRHIDIRNFTVTKDYFIKIIPMNKKGDYIQLFKSKKSFDHTLEILKIKIILLQIILLLLFAYISYKLAKNALKPLQESIITLDKFAKDLIHDLNTPVTSIKLNMKLLEKEGSIKRSSPLQRIQKSVETISELHESLTLLLQEETFQLQETNVCKLVEELVQVHKQLYPQLHFSFACSHFHAKLNKQALKQIVQNLLTNACKHNTGQGYVKIYTTHKSLHIQNSGEKIENPQRIFERSYSGNNTSSGIGLDIVNRLAKAMDIKITVVSKEGENSFILTIP
jgi:two-component system OmpR family sensor kinase